MLLRIQPSRQNVALIVTLAAAIVLLALPGEAILTKAGIVVCLSIGLWASGALPEWLTALVFFTVCMVAAVAPPTEVFAGFSSSATWLVVSGVVIGGAIGHTGLGNRLAARLAPAIGRSFPRAVALVALFGMAMTFVMPSAMGRLVLLMPILQALAERLGYPRGAKGHAGLLFAGMFGTYQPASSILPANVPNNIFVGTVESVLGAAPTYGEYFLLHFPVLGALRMAFLVPLLIAVFRDRPMAGSAPDQSNSGHEPMSTAERRLAGLLALGVVLWATDGWHGISAAWVGMAVALGCLIPGSGLMPERPLRALSFEPVFYVAGIVGMGAVADHSGLGGHVTHWLLSALPLEADAPLKNFYLLSGLSTVVGLVVTLPSIPAIMTPLTLPLAHVTHWSPEAVAMTQVVAYATVILPYQSAPVVVAAQVGGLRAATMARLCLVVAGFTILCLWPIDYLWWRSLGWIG